MNDDDIRKLIRDSLLRMTVPDKWVLVQDPDTGALIPVARELYERAKKKAGLA